jgi:HAD superfamily hydrolase (TIGR01509 family)
MPPRSIGDGMKIEAREIAAAILDLDGVITDTATLHAKAWERVWNEFLAHWEKATGERHEPFSYHVDYLKYLDGKPRYQGAEAFLASRKIEIPFGHPGDEPGLTTICATGNLKNRYYLALLDQEGPLIYADTVDVVKRWRAEGLKTAVVSSSRNCKKVLEAAAITDLFDVVLDGLDMERLGLKGKPEPDMFLEAAQRLGHSVKKTLVVEDAFSGIEAARRGGFGLVVAMTAMGSDPKGRASELRDCGADLIVQNLSQLLDSEMTDWQLIYKKWVPDKQSLRESLCALGNGYSMVRGAFSEAKADRIHYPGCYLSGTYNRATSEIHGRLVEHEDLVNWPSWLEIGFRIGKDEWFKMDGVEILSFRQILDVKEGTLSREMRTRDAKGRESLLCERRFVHMAEIHLSGVEWSLTPLNWRGMVTIRSGIDGDVVNDNVGRYRELNRRHLKTGEKGLVGETAIFLESQSLQSEIKVTHAARTELYLNELLAPAVRKTFVESDRIWQELQIRAEKNQQLTLEKIVATYSSRDLAISEPTIEAKEAVMRAGRFARLLVSHRQAWEHVWSRCDLELEDGYTQFVLRLHVFHILQTASPWSLDIDNGIPARGWHGEAYRGHVFWDELFVMAFINMRVPELSREILMYRYRRLGQARQNAKSMGYTGAMYPWQSGSNGREESPVTHLNPVSGEWIEDVSSWQRHVGAAITYNIWQYYKATHDTEFLSSYGAKMFLEIARFFAGLATYDSKKARYEILQVMGPDEFHTGYPWRKGKGVDNNAYTNIMVSWTLAHGLRVLEILGEKRRAELVAELCLTDEELYRWEEVSRKLYVPFFGDGLIAQFEHFDRLKELDWDLYRKRYGNIQRLDRILVAENDSPDDYKLVKQADVIMLFFLFSTEELESIFERLGYSFDPEMIPRNIDYYASRVSHGSTLSRIVHAWVLARLDRPRAWHLFKESLQSDISDIQGGTTSEGVHLGAMAGTVDMIQRCFTGLEMREDVLWFNPNLPDELPTLKFPIRYAGHWLQVSITHERLVISLEHSWSGSVRIGCRSEIVEMRQGDWHVFDLREDEPFGMELETVESRREMTH